MSVFSKKILLAALTTALAGSAQTATASSSASAHIDWDSLTIQYFDLSFNTNTPSLTWTQEQGSAWSSAYTFDPSDSQNDYQSIYDFSSTLSTNASTLYAQSSSLRDSDDLNAYAASQESSSSSFVFSDNYAYAYSWNNGYFQMTGKGIALITLNWSASGTSTGNDYNDYANAQVYISGNFTDNNGNNGSSYTNYNRDTVYDGPFNQSGTFSMAIFSDGINTVTGSLYAQTYADSQSLVSSVPVPAAVWLFGSSLIGMVGIARRKRIA